MGRLTRIMASKIQLPKTIFSLPPKNSLPRTGPTDPIFYYYHPLTAFLYRGRIRQALSLLNPPYKSVLELGYGSGILLPTLASIGDEVAGLDLDADPLVVQESLNKIGVETGKIFLSGGDIADMNMYQPSSFDLVVAISIFEHIKDLSAPLSEVRRVLKPQGHLLVGMPRVDSMMSKLFSMIGFSGIEAHHITDYQQFLKSAQPMFELKALKSVPGFLPNFCGLYFNMLLDKKG